MHDIRSYSISYNMYLNYTAVNSLRIKIQYYSLKLCTVVQVTPFLFLFAPIYIVCYIVLIALLC